VHRRGCPANDLIWIVTTRAVGVSTDTPAWLVLHAAIECLHTLCVVKENALQMNANMSYNMRRAPLTPLLFTTMPNRRNTPGSLCTQYGRKAAPPSKPLYTANISDLSMLHLSRVPSRARPPHPTVQRRCDARSRGAALADRSTCQRSRAVRPPLAAHHWPSWTAPTRG
jgi:hypothetical protein